MPAKSAVVEVAAHPVLPDMGSARMAKAPVRIPDSVDFQAEIGAAIQKAVLDVWASNKLAAAELKVDDAEFGKWMNGNRRPQFDKLWAVARLRKPLVIALAELAQADVRTESGCVSNDLLVSGFGSPYRIR